MTNSHEPSYYEIALTNRQVVVAFVILLICLVSAFFSGLWIGRESAARAQQQLVQATPPAQTDPQQGQELEEFEFFDDEQKPAEQTPQEAVPTPAPAETPADETEDTTLFEDLGGEGDAEVAGDPDLPEGRRRRGAAPVEETDEEPAAPTPTPQRSAPTPTPAPARASNEPRLAAGQVVIQVFSSGDEDQAESVRDRLNRGGHKAFLSPVQVGGRTMYRVRIGPFNSRGDAQKVAEQVRTGYKLDTWVTE